MAPRRKSNDRRSKVVVMLTCQYTEILGGAEKQCAALTRNLKHAGANVVVLTSRVPGNKPSDLESGVIRFWTYCPPQLAGRHLLGSLLWSLQALIWIAWNNQRIMVLHCHQLRINAYVAAVANAMFGIPTIMKPGVGGDRNDFNIIGQRKYLFGKSGARFVVSRSSAVIAISSEIEKNCLEWGVPSERILKIPNGVDLDRVKEISVGHDSKRFEYFEKCPRFVFIGRLSPEKNLLSILDAAAAIQTKRKYCIELLGDGPLKDAIKTRPTERYGPEIVLNGRVEDVFPHLQRMHFLILVSSSEGLSNALLEAACSGVVPILSDVSGNRDVVDFLEYPLFVQGAGSEQIERVLNKALNMGPEEWATWSSRIADQSRSKYDSTLVRDRYLALYDELAGETVLQKVDLSDSSDGIRDR